MKIDLMGNAIKVDELSTIGDIEVSNGTFIITEAETAIDFSNLSNLKSVNIINNQLVLKKSMSKWRFIKCCLRLAWERLKE